MKHFGNDGLRDDRDEVNESNPEFVRRGRIVAYVDGAMDVAEARVFEAEILRDPALAQDVERARCLRALVATLPRAAAPELVRRFTERLTESSRRASGSALGVADQLASVPLRAAPVDLRARILESIRRERSIVETARSRRAYRPSLRLLAPAAIAAALLVGVTTWLVEMRPTRPERPLGARRFVFDIVTVRPGVASGAPSAVGDPTLVPPRALSRDEERLGR